MNQVNQATAAATTAAATPAQLELEGTDVILVKFTFKDQAHIPLGIEKIERAPDYQMDVKHQLDAIKAGHGKSVTTTGRVRKNRVDTGTQVIACRRPTQAAMIRRGLVAQGYRLTHLHWFMRDGKPKGDDRQSADPIYVVCAAFAKIEGAQVTSFSRQAEKSLRDLATQTWNNCYVWDNPANSNGLVVATINFVNLMNASQKPKEALVARKGVIKVEQIAAPVAEEQE